jgi:hypothetical protein
MPFDYSKTADPKDFSQPIPDGTLATVLMRLRPGGVGEDGLLKRTASGEAEMLDCEFVIVDGEYAKRKFWDTLILEGATDGQKQMADTNRGRLKKILESARGIKKDMPAEQARALYQASLKDFDGLAFVARIGMRKGEPKKDGSGNWPDKNFLAAAISPDHRDWHPVEQEQPLPFNGGGAAASPASTTATNAPPAGSAPIQPPKWAS